jgi:predicted RNase H-like HicB family nuclease
VCSVCIYTLDAWAYSNAVRLRAAENEWKMRQYIALIHKEADSDYGISFPDLPGVISAGRTLDETRDMGAEALALHLEGMAADGEAAPEPSSLEVIMKDAQNKDGVAVLIAAPGRRADR